MKDHKKAEWVNRITATAKKYGATQQLRARIHKDVLELIDQAKQEQMEKDVGIVNSFDDGAGGGVDPQEIVKAIFDQRGQ